MAKSAEQRSKFAALHRWWWRLHMSEKFSSGTKNNNKKTSFGEGDSIVMFYSKTIKAKQWKHTDNNWLYFSRTTWIISTVIYTKYSLEKQVRVYQNEGYAVFQGGDISETVKILRQNWKVFLLQTVLIKGFHFVQIKDNFILKIQIMITI